MDTININPQDLNHDKIIGIIDELTLRCYIYNRQRSPEISVDQWANPKVFGQNAYLYEIEMQRRTKK